MFRGFKAQLNILSGKNENSHLSPDLFVTGAYRINREDAYGFNSLDSDFRPADQIRPTKSTSNLLQPQTSEPKQNPSKLDQAPLQPVKSTSNLQKTQTPNSKLRNSTPAVSTDPRGGVQDNQNVALSPKEVKNRDIEKKKIDKQRLAEQKKQAKEKEKQEKLLRETEKKKEKQRLAEQKKQAQEAAKQEKLPQQKAKKQGQLCATNKRKKQALPIRQQQTQPESASGTSNLRPAYSTNTLESSISKSSGPPPYSDVPKPEPVQKDKTNVAYSKPVDNGSWDIISQHRQQMSRPAPAPAPAVGVETKRKQVVMDLNFKFDADTNKDNSEA